MTLEEAVILIYSMRRDNSGDHERPHKPIMLLAVLDLIEKQEIVANEVSPTAKLRSAWVNYFEALKKGNDGRTPQNPFYHLSGEPFWDLEMKQGIHQIYIAGASGSAPSWKGLQEGVAFAKMDPGFCAHMMDPVGREALREAIISRYFPGQRELVRKVSRENSARTKPSDDPKPKLPPGRDAGFRKVVMEIYDYRCAACGLRVILDNIVMVEAAHLIPYSESKDDNPKNGMALCRNHHFAMDRFLIAPCPDGKWHVSSRLDDRIEGQQELLKLDSRSIILPKKRMFSPKEEALVWRQRKLLN